MVCSNSNLCLFCSQDPAKKSGKIILLIQKGNGRPQSATGVETADVVVDAEAQLIAAVRGGVPVERSCALSRPEPVPK